MINASNIVCLKILLNQFMFINLKLHKRYFIDLFKTANITFLSYIRFELLDDKHGTPILQKNVKCNYPGLTLAIDPTSPQGEFRTL